MKILLEIAKILAVCAVLVLAWRGLDARVTVAARADLQKEIEKANENLESLQEEVAALRAEMRALRRLASLYRRVR